MGKIGSLPLFDHNHPMIESLEDYLQRIETDWANSNTQHDVDVFDELSEFEDFQPFN